MDLLNDYYYFKVGFNEDILLKNLTMIENLQSNAGDGLPTFELED